MPKPCSRTPGLSTKLPVIQMLSSDSNNKMKLTFRLPSCRQLTTELIMRSKKDKALTKLTWMIQGQRWLTTETLSKLTLSFCRINWMKLRETKRLEPTTLKPWENSTGPRCRTHKQQEKPLEFSWRTSSNSTKITFNQCRCNSMNSLLRETVSSIKWMD